jgi:hypothetical protein
MNHTFDIFEVARDGVPIRIKTFTSPEEVSAHLLRIYRLRPAHYVVFDRETKGIIIELNDRAGARATHSSP